MRPTQVADTLKTMVKIQRPIMLHGSPGIGKSDVVRSVAQDLKMELMDLRLSQLDPVDLRGVPNVENRTTCWNTPDFLPTEGKGILFLDEINSAPQATQAAAYQLILDRKLGNYTLPDGWTMIAAGNRASDKALVNQMSTALKNRFIHIDYEVNNDDWCQWALAHDIAPEVLSFIRFRPMLLNEFDTRGTKEEDKARLSRIRDTNAFATPRTWAFTSDILKERPAEDTEYELYAGTIGEGVAAEFLGFIKNYRNLPNLDTLLMNPKKTPVPEEPATLYALATGLASKATPDNMERVVEYTLRMPAEFQVLLIKDAAVRDKALTETKAFNAWIMKHTDILF